MLVYFIWFLKRRKDCLISKNICFSPSIFFLSTSINALCLRRKSWQMDSILKFDKYINWPKIEVSQLIERLLLVISCYFNNYSVQLILTCNSLGIVYWLGSQIFNYHHPINLWFIVITITWYQLGRLTNNLQI